MILIAHRGNYQGPNNELENSLPYLKKAISFGYDVEVDIWKIRNTFYLGHDCPSYKIDFIDVIDLAPHAWFHAKNLAALFDLVQLGANVFSHDQDDYVLTSKGHIWSYSGKYAGKNVIACMPELTEGFKVSSDTLGICSDFLLDPSKYVLADPWEDSHSVK